MSQPAGGLLRLDDLARLVGDGQITTVDVVFPDLYGRLVGKRLDANYFLDNGAAHGTHACDYLLIADLDMTPVPGYATASWERGFGDFRLAPDLSTLRVASWRPATALVICDATVQDSSEPVAVAPRTLLADERRRWQSLGLTTLAASELEYYVFADSYQAAADKHYHRLTPTDRHRQDYRTSLMSHETFHAASRSHLVRSGVPVEGSKGEWGVGQHELNLRAAEVLEMADRHVIFKHCLKDVADAHGLSVTFMAKPDQDAAGSSSHLHLSVWHRDENLCSSPAVDAAMRPELRWMLGGLARHARDFMAFYAPTVNAYKRFQAGSWAPTGTGWAHDNRTTAFRLVGKGGTARIECRIPGADCNPYLAYTACLASARAGLTERVEPTAPVYGNSYAVDDVPPLPHSLAEAACGFRSSALVRDTIGIEAQAHYARFFETEQHAFDRAVTDWERVRYFERI